MNWGRQEMKLNPKSWRSKISSIEDVSYLYKKNLPSIDTEITY
jgi:hypothetical protein